MSDIEESAVFTPEILKAAIKRLSQYDDLPMQSHFVVSKKWFDSFCRLHGISDDQREEAMKNNMFLIIEEPFAFVD